MVETTDGRRMREVVDYCKGMPQNPMSLDEVKEKFLSLVEPVLPPGRPRQIMDAIDNIESVTNMADFAQLLVVPPELRKPVYQ